MAHDAFSDVGRQSGTFSWTHTPFGTPSGVLVFIMRIDGVATSAISSVTYGGVSMTAVPGGVAQDLSGEPGLCITYVLASSVPTGAQTVQVTTSAGEYDAGAITVTSVGDIGIAGIVLLEGDGVLSEQSVDDGSPGSPSMRYAGGFSGRNTPPMVGSHSTSLRSSDNGTDSVVICRETNPGQGSRPIGFADATTDDRAFVHLAVYELGS